MCKNTACAISNTTPCVFVFNFPGKKATEVNHMSKMFEDTGDENVCSLEQDDGEELLFLSLRKQKNLNSLCLHKKALISNIIKNIKNNYEELSGQNIKI